MKHVFLLLVYIGAGDDRYLASNDMFFASIERCNYFASEVSRRFGSPNDMRYNHPKDAVIAYCVPKFVNIETLLEIY